MILAVLIAWIISNPTVLAQGTSKNPIVVHGDMNYPPYESLVDGKPVGLNVDLWKEIAKVLGRPVEYRLYQWGDSQARVKRGEGNVLSFMSFSKKRDALYDFTTPTFYFKYPVFVHADSVDKFDVSNLTGKRIAVKKGGFPRTIIETLHPGAEMVFIDSPLDGFRKLLSNEVDGVVEDELVGYTVLQQNGLQSIRATDQSLASKPGHIAVVAGNMELVDQLNGALNKLKNSGKFDQIADKWAGTETVLYRKETIWYVTSAVGITIIFLFSIGGTAYVFKVRKINAALNRQVLEQKCVKAALMDSEQRFKNFAESASDWFWEMDEDLRYTYVSDRYKQITGIEPADRIGTRRWDFANSNVDPEKWAVHKCDLKAKRNFKDFEYFQDKANVHLRVSGAPIFDDEGTFKGYRGSTSNITDSKQLEDQLRQSQRMEAVGQLTGGVAHDFNNLLHVMIGNAEMLMLKMRGDKKYQQYVDNITRAVDSASSLTSRLLAFSRQQTLSPVAANVTENIGNLDNMLQRTLGETINLKVVHTPDLWLATIDTHQFENALVNLALNARDAMPKGGKLTIETANVTLDATYAKQYKEVALGDYVKVAVSDTGTGMSPDVSKKVFEPFFTTKDVGKGSGLGLSMVYGFVKQSAGHITIYSEKEHGTTVKLYMPRSHEGTPQDVAKVNTQEFTLGTERILIVEDDENVLEISTNILSEQGYEIVVAVDGKEAIKHLNDDQHFDLLFTDVILPAGMNGVEIAEQAKQLHPDIKVLYTTGYTENSVVHNGKLDPGVTLVNKPYRRAELLEKVRTILDIDIE